MRAPRCYHRAVMARFFEYPDTILPEGEGGAGGGGRGLLISMRWAAVIGQAAALLVTQYGLGFDLPIVPALAVVAASALINVGHALLRRPQRRLSERDAAFTLGYDVLQLGLLLYLTRGLQEPLPVPMNPPVPAAATILSPPSVICLPPLA